MDLVITHDVPDFDALASAVAALKLYPGATIALGKRLGRDVQAFVSLHKDRFPTMAVQDVDVRAVRRAVVVDVRRACRLGHIAALRDRILSRDSALEVHVWDHHRAAADDIPAGFEKIERVGSVTTLLVEEIRGRGVAVDAVEATLFALGIHVDTGSPRHSGTTSRDAAALAWLLDQGARLSVINRYLELPFTEGQLRALSALLEAVHVERVAGARVGVAKVPEGYGVDGLDEVTNEVLALENIHGLVASFGLRGGRAQIIARSREPWLDVGKALQAAGGGGHATAGAAVIRDGNADSAMDAVLAALRAAAPRPVSVRDVMSSPVYSVRSDTLVKALRDSLASWGYTGAPVMKDEKLVGVISRRDVEAAVANGREGDRASRFMSQPVHTTDEDALLDDALARMTAADIGRLIVVRGDRVVGILTRRDVLEVLYRQD